MSLPVFEIFDRKLVYSPRANKSWNQTHAILPTPVQLDDQRIRIFFASCDDALVGFTHWIDVNAENPWEILEEADEPCLLPGELGTFDEHGVNPSFAYWSKSSLKLLYVGYQRGVSVPYSLFAGYATSEDQGRTFKKPTRVPYLERLSDELNIRSAPFLAEDSLTAPLFYVALDRWREKNGQLYPTYSVRKTTMASRAEPGASIIVLSPDFDGDECGFGRPWIIRSHDRYFLFFSIRRISGKKMRYVGLGCAHSEDLLRWVRADHLVKASPSAEEWDADSLCYMSFIQVQENWYCFYNGNDNGRTGFGCARLVAKG